MTNTYLSAYEKNHHVGMCALLQDLNEITIETFKVKDKMKITRRTKTLLGLRITFQVIVAVAMISQMANATTYQQLPFNFIYNKKSCEALKATIEKADPNSNVTTGGFKFQDKSYGSLWYDSIGEYNTHCTKITGSLTP